MGWGALSVGGAALLRRTAVRSGRPCQEHSTGRRRHRPLSRRGSLPAERHRRCHRCPHRLQRRPSSPYPFRAGRRLARRPGAAYRCRVGVARSAAVADRRRLPLLRRDAAYRGSARPLRLPDAGRQQCHPRLCLLSHSDKNLLRSGVAGRAIPRLGRAKRHRQQLVQNSLLGLGRLRHPGPRPDKPSIHRL